MRSPHVETSFSAPDQGSAQSPGATVLLMDRAALHEPAPGTSAPVEGNGARVLLIASVWGGAALHGAAVPDHVNHWPLAGAFFALLALTGALLGAVLAGSWRATAAARATILINALTLGVWAISRAAGLPFGPDAGTPEAVGGLDLSAATLHLAAIGFAVHVLRTQGRKTTWDRPLPMKLALVGIVVVTTLGLSAAGAHAVQSGHGHPGEVSASRSGQ